MGSGRSFRDRCSLGDEKKSPKGENEKESSSNPEEKKEEKTSNGLNDSYCSALAPSLIPSSPYSSYTCFFSGSERTLYAIEIFLNYASVAWERDTISASPPLSGWYLKASRLYDFRITSGVASLSTPRIV